MTLGELLREAERWGQIQDLTPAVLAQEVTDVAYDSRRVAPGAVFVALRGQRTDGVAFVKQAIERGAIAIVSDTPAPGPVAVPWLVAGDARGALAVLAAAFFHQPSEEMALVGVTGTNGKTTTTYLLCSIFEAAGIPCGRIGTVGYRIGAEERAAERTTPEAPDVQRLLREMVDRGLGACAMEVSSHALSLRRVDAIRFRAAVFTNLTRDHLDFHGDMESYFAAKRRLFEMLPEDAVSVINTDDPRGAELAMSVRRPVTYAIDRRADATPGALTTSLQGLTFEVTTPRGRLRVRSRLLGRPNAYNILAAAATAMALDLPFSAIEAGVTALEHVPGRFQVVSGASDEVTVVVDYAHTDDALKNLLETARPLAPGRLITVFGCGGDRDRTKRPLMGAVAARLSDLVVLTSDNPRSEDPDSIIEEIKRGIVPAPEKGPYPFLEQDQSKRGTAPFPKDGRGGGPKWLAVTDRRAAIERAIVEAEAGDVVLIAGKGHEKYQVIADRTLPFDDVEVAKAALARRRTNSRVS